MGLQEVLTAHSFTSFGWCSCREEGPRFTWSQWVTHVVGEVQAAGLVVVPTSFSDTLRHVNKQTLDDCNRLPVNGPQWNFTSGEASGVRIALGLFNDAAETAAAAVVEEGKPAEGES